MTEKDIKIQVRTEVKKLLLDGYYDQILIDKCVEKTLEAINYSRCCKSDSEQLPSKEEMNAKLYALANELKTDDKQTEKIYFESGFRYCQQVIKEHLEK